MTVSQFIGYRLNNTAAVTTYTSTRIYHGNIPESVTTLPAINYFKVSHNSLQSTTVIRDHFQISVRASTAETAWTIAEEVVKTFFELQGTINNFDVQNCYFDAASMIAETNTVYHVPIDIYVLYKQ